MKLFLVFNTLIAYVCVCYGQTPWFNNFDVKIRYDTQISKLFNDDLAGVPVYCGVGYDALEGNPLTNKIDPGFRQTIFDFAYDEDLTTEDNMYRIPNGMKTRSRKACSFSAKTEEVTNTADYQSSLETHAEVEGSYGSSFSFSASADYKQFETESRTKNTISTLSSAQCEVYWLEMPVFSNFKLSDDFMKGATDAYNGVIPWRKFIRAFGTHFVTQLVLGGRMHLETKFEKSTYQSMKERKINVQMAAQAAFFEEVAGGTSSSSSTSSTTTASSISTTTVASEEEDPTFKMNFDQYKNDTETFQSSASSQNAIYIGGAPPAGGDWTEWQQAVISELAPIWYNLESIGDLFTQKYFVDVSDEDLATMKTQFENAVVEHCEDNECSSPNYNEYGALAIYRTEYLPKIAAGTFFEFMAAVDVDMAVKTIQMKISDRIQSIQLVVKNFKKTVTSDRFGSAADSTNSYDVPLGEYINRIEFTYDNLGIKSLVFSTNADSTSPTFGQVAENYQLVELHGKLVGIYGYAVNDYIVSIGFISSEQVYDSTSLGATVYDGPNFDGLSMSLPFGASIDDLSTYGFDKKVSSIQVFSTVRVCSAVEFGGICDFLSKGRYSEKRLRLNNYMTSIGVISQEQIGAIMYTDINYKGESLYLMKDESLADLSEKGWADRMSSIKIFGWVKACTDVDFGGSCRYFNPSYGDQSYVGSFLNEQVQSIASYSSESIIGVFFQNASYQGSRFVMRLGDSIPDLSTNGFDNQISSFRLVTGVHVLLCNDINFSGFCVYESTGSKEILLTASDNKISSIMFGNNRDRYILLNNYWPIQNDLKDVIGSADLTPVGTAKLVNDRFDTENSALSIAQGGYYDVPDGNYFSDEFTIAAWVKPTDGSHTVILDFGNGEGNDVIEFFIHMPNMYPWIYIRNGYSVVTDLSFNKAIPLNAWTHLVVTVSNSNLKIRCYINGQFVKEQAISTPVVSKARTTNFFGKSNWIASPNGNADLDQIKIFSAVLGENDILLEFQGEPENKRVFLANSWPLFNGTLTDTINDANLTVPSTTTLNLAYDRHGTFNGSLFLDFQYLTVPSGFYFGANGFTIVLWAKQRDTSKIDSTILDFGNGILTDSVKFLLSDLTTQKPALYIYVNNELSNKIVFDQALVLNQWTHIAVSVSAAKMSAYLNGALINEIFNSDLPRYIERTRNYIGRTSLANENTKANFNDLRIYNAALSATEISQDYTATKSILRHYWPFSGTHEDVISAANMANPVNAGFVSDRLGKPSRSLSINNGGFNLPSGVYFDGEFTISIWIYPRSASQTLAKIFEIGNGVSNDNVVFYMAFNDDLLRPYISYYVYGGEVANLRCSQAMAVNEWAHVAFTVSATRISAYINGVLINDKDNSGRALPRGITRTNVLFGSSVSGFAKPNAAFDYFRIFSVSLTADQIAQEYTFFDA